MDSTTTAFTLRIDDDIIEKLDQLWPLYGFKSRNQYLDYLIRQIVQQGFIPTRVGEGYGAKAPGGGQLSLIQQAGFISSGESGLNEQELAVFQQAQRWAEQGQWYKARQHLREAGFEIEYILK